MADIVHNTKITDLDIPFWRMVALLIKWAFAAVPAVLILWFVVIATGAVFGTLFGYTMHWFGDGYAGYRY